MVVLAHAADGVAIVAVFVLWVVLQRRQRRR